MPTKLDSTSSQRECTTRSWWTPVAGLLAAGLVTALVACGGGGGGSSAGVGTGGTGAFAVGTISGFGSVIVNGVRYDDSNASIVDDDGSASSSSALSIGQVVEVLGSVKTDGLTGTASRVSYYSELKGPITSVGGSTVTVFGQVVTMTATTVFEGVSGLSALAQGNVIEVYGLPDGSGGITATRIEFEASTILGFSGDFRIRGVVSGPPVATAPGQRFTVGSVTVQTDNTTQVEGTIADGVFVRVRLDKTAISANTYLAKRVKVKTRTYESGVSKAEVEGLISEFTSSSAPFKVNGYPVQLDPSATFEPVDGTLADGVRIEAKGTVTNGVLVISKVEFDNEDNDGGDDGNDAPFEFHGVATCSVTPCSSPAGSFVVRNDVTVQYDSTTQFSGVTAANLNGARVEVKAIAQSGSGGTTLLATRIQLDN